MMTPAGLGVLPAQPSSPELGDSSGPSPALEQLEDGGSPWGASSARHFEHSDGSEVPLAGPPAGQQPGGIRVDHYDSAGNLVSTTIVGQHLAWDQYAGADGIINVNYAYSYECWQDGSEPSSVATSTPMPEVQPTTPLVPAGTMVFVPDGDYWNGLTDELAFLAEYQIDRTEVTVDAYQACVGDGACTLPSHEGLEPRGNYITPGRQNHPINGLSLDQAAAYCEWSGKRLCTSPEWEKAARGGCELHQDCAASASLKTPWGGADGTNCDVSNTFGCSWATVRVGALPQGASPYGVLNMAGNVCEWVDGATPSIRGDCWNFDDGTFSDAGMLGHIVAPSGATGLSLGMRCCSSP